jgi:hypothetical protein
MAIERISNALKRVTEVFYTDASFVKALYRLPPFSLITQALGLVPSEKKQKLLSIPVVCLSKVPSPDEAARKRADYSATRVNLTVALGKLQSSFNKVSSLKNEIKAAQLVLAKLMASDELSLEDKSSKKLQLDQKISSLTAELVSAEKICYAAQSEVKKITAALRAE